MHLQHRPYESVGASQRQVMTYKDFDRFGTIVRRPAPDEDTGLVAL